MEAMLATSTLAMAIERLLALRDSVIAGVTPPELAVLATIAILKAAGESDAERAAADALTAYAGGLIEHLGPDIRVVYNIPFPLVLAGHYDKACAGLDAAVAGSPPARLAARRRAGQRVPGPAGAPARGARRRRPCLDRGRRAAVDRAPDGHGLG